MSTLEIRRLGLVPYAEGAALQRELVEQRRAGRIGDVLLLLEHPHVLTVGVRADARLHIVARPEVLSSRGVEVHDTGRGGDITYHGPGQLVGYPIVDLRPDRCDVHRYVRDLEEVLIRVATDCGIQSVRREPGLTGVWVGSRKLAAIGVRISRWVTSHGFALNVTTDLSYFDLIVPCGIPNRGVTSLARLGSTHTLFEVEDRIVARFCEVFDRQPIEMAAVSAGGSR